MARLSQVLVPKDRLYFDLFEEAAGNIVRAADLLDQLLRSYPDRREELTRDILICEQEGDRITHDIIRRLNETFVTPIDREDIHSLARTLDDVMDAIDNAASLIPLYKIDRVRPGARELAKIISSSTDEVRRALEALEKRSGVMDRAVEINRLENEADRVHQRAVGQLFDEERDPVIILKWKEILDLLEEATDRCEDVANLLENVVVKHG
jgi:predicted phosphate transport protein (TIGR00153 family)